jgi:hypothetical protein
MIDLSEAQASMVRKMIRPGVVLSSHYNAVVESISPDLQTIVLSQNNVDSPREFELSSVSYGQITYHPKDDDWVVDDDAIVLYEDEYSEQGAVAYYGS